MSDANANNSDAIHQTLLEHDGVCPDGGSRSCLERFITPRVVLAIFTAMNFITYYDRGVIAGCLSNVKADKVISGGNTLSDAKSGAIVSAFMVGYMVTCPLFVGLGGVLTAKMIILIGLLSWAVACLLTGFSMDYAMIICARCLVGIGEAAYAGFSITIIDNIAPPATRIMWIGIFYCMIPVGTSIGMALGGILGSDGAIGNIPGWRVAFVTEVIAMLPVIVLVALIPSKYNPIQKKKKEEAQASVNINDGDAPPPGQVDKTEGHHIPLHRAVLLLFKNLNYWLIVFGYGMYTFVLGAIAVWAISMLMQGPLRLSEVNASLLIGGSVAFSGLVGSIVGGRIVDVIGGSKGMQGVYKCSLFNTIMMTISLPLGLGSLFVEQLWLFCILFVAAVFSLFTITAPVNAAILSVVHPDLRTYAMSFEIFLIHAMGDFPSPIVAGKLSDVFDNDCHEWSKVNEGNCTANVTQHCVWMPKHKLEDPYCANTYQLRNALAIVFAFIFLAIPAWILLTARSYRSWKKEAAESPSEEFPSSLSLATREGSGREKAN